MTTEKFLDGNDVGIWRFDPATSLWTNVNGNLNTIQFYDIALDPTNANIAFGGSQDNGTSRFNNSLTWTAVEGGDGGIVAVSPNNSSRVYHDAPFQSFGAGANFKRSD